MYGRDGVSRKSTACRASQVETRACTVHSAKSRASASIGFACRLRTTTSKSVGPLPFRYSCTVNRNSCTARYVGATPGSLGSVSVVAVADCSVARTITSARKICCSMDGATRQVTFDDR